MEIMKPMQWERLISDLRLGMEEWHDDRQHTRSEFQRDYDRLVFSSAFRRLQNKTQVFPLPGSIFVHNRLTHSLEVSSVGRSMAREALLHLVKTPRSQQQMSALQAIPDIVATACLCHDLGNPPFGHSGEKTIATFFSEGKGKELQSLLSDRQWCDVVNFEGNANSFRLLTNQFCGRREGGFAMTYSTLASIVKYPYPSTLADGRQKFGYFESEEGIYNRVADKLGIIKNEDGSRARHPLTYLMEAADDICYQIMDIEDSHRLHILRTEEVIDLFMNFFDPERKERKFVHTKRLADPNEQIAYLRSSVIGTLVTNCATTFAQKEQEILRGELKSSLIDNMDVSLKNAYQECSNTAWAKIYRAPHVADVEIAGNRILTYLMEVLTEAVLNPERNFSRLLLEQVPNQYDVNAPTVYGKIQSVLDHVSGMTDVYALNLFRKLNGHSLPAV